MLAGMRSDAVSVDAYIAALPDDRRDAITVLRSTILKNLPKGFVETMNWGMISYEVPLAIEPNTYNGQPLSYAALASQKNNLAFYYSCGTDNGAALRAVWKNPRKKADVGKSCLRFRAIEDIDLDGIGMLIASKTVTDVVKTAKR
jgi:hypothetical protein